MIRLELRLQTYSWDINNSKNVTKINPIVGFIILTRKLNAI